MTVDLDALRAKLEAALAASDVAGAWALLEAHRGRLAEDPAIAFLWLDLLEASPGRPSLLAEVREVLETWPNDPTLVLAANAALVRAAEARPPDEPTLRRDGPAVLAAQAAARCLDALDDAARGDPDVAGFLWASRGNALRLAGPDEDAAAQDAFARALALDASRGGLWFDLGLLHKWRGRFAEGFDCNLKARARLGETRPVLWNLAICATALGDGDVAAARWQELGFPVRLSERGKMPVVDGLPPVAVRVLARGAGFGPANGAVPDRATVFEIVRVAALSPCHGVVESPTFRDAPIDYGDVVLWDGAPVGKHDSGDRTLPIFPVLEVLRRGDERRLRFVALEQAEGDVDTVARALPEGARLFVQQARVEEICPRCAAGEAWTRHEHAPPEAHRVLYGKIVATAEQSLSELRDAIESVAKRDGRAVLAVPALYEALGDSARAGREHQTWRSIERLGERRSLSGA